MGFYINPVDGSNKEEWLAQNGTRLGGPGEWDDVPDDCCLVCLVENGPFRAAGIVYSQQELEDWSYTGDYRPKQWYLITKADAVTHSNIELDRFK